MQATCAGIGVALGGVVRDIPVATPDLAELHASRPYNVVFMIEMAFLALAVILAVPVVWRVARAGASGVQPKPVEA